jgi:hypothetical protein
MLSKDQLTPPKQTHSFLNVDSQYLAASLILIVIVSCVLLNGKKGPFIELYDCWEHTACIKEMSRNLLDPRNPFLQIGSETTPRYTPYIFFLALIKNIAGMEMSSLLVMISVINFIILLTGVYLFCEEYFCDKKQPLYTLVTLLFLWGGFFGFSSEYNLWFLSYTLFYPSIVTFTLSFAGLYCFLMFARYNNIPCCLLYFIISVFIIMTHPLTGSFYMLSVFLLAASEGSNLKLNMGIFVLSSLIAFVLLLIWPYYSFLEALYSSVSTPWAEETRMYLYSPSNLYKIGPAILGIPVVIVFLKERRHPLISFGFIICASIYIFSFKPKIFLGERYIFYTIFFMHLALSWYLKKLGILSFSTVKEVFLKLNDKNIHVLVFIIILFGGVLCQILKLGFEQFGYSIYFSPKPEVTKYEDPTEKYNIIKGKLKEGDVVLSDPLTSWLIPTLTDAKIVALHHDSPLVPDNMQRFKDSIEFYKKDTTLHSRIDILKKYNITHVLLNFHRMEKTFLNSINNYCSNFMFGNRTVEDLKKIGKIIIKNNTFILFKINKTTYPAVRIPH